MHLKHRHIQGPLPTSRFDLMDDASVVPGFCQLKHRAACGSYLPTEAASNVYYQIEAPYRGRGYGKVLMGLALAEAKRIGLEKVRLTVDDDNPVSRHIIELHGATWLRDFIDAEAMRCHLYEVAT